MEDDWLDDWGPGVRPRRQQRDRRRTARLMIGWTIVGGVLLGLAWLGAWILQKTSRGDESAVVPVPNYRRPPEP